MTKNDSTVSIFSELTPQKSRFCFKKPIELGVPHSLGSPEKHRGNCTLCDRHTCSNSMAHLVSFLQRKQTQPSWDLRLRLSKLGNQSDQSSSWQIFITAPIKDDLHKSDIINTAPGTLPIYCKDLFTIHCTALPHFLELPYWHYQLVLS